ncbi:biotin-dependent carboxyltransferase family protein [Peptoniphilus sp. oral taxon 386]|uniref:5-oxoprolinase subunit C family protein n=1 Tax=Peptoniphilus sp. oral taxon 386 TaxID=652713 RepID=UPI0001DA99D8|nr:biotin-dependent carboxyltransferase family protein [Peptoniphilus sp. oral taxon 386]EFI41778.1 biotin-dependent carboxylase domain protein [Peptoniphilus sp. oral taxon 386 str. F0131]
MAKIKVLNGGIYTTVQDYGRIGYQKFGIAPAGVMDEYSYELANALTGNKRGEAVLEITYLGPMLKFEDEVVIAVTGANVSPKIDGVPINMYESYKIGAGSTLSFGKLIDGVRAYLAFGGEIDVPVVNGSKSTLVKSKIGGYEGRPLKAGDEFEVKVNEAAKEGKILPDKYKAQINKFNVIRVVLGPQDDYFTEDGIKKLFRSGGYTLTKNIDRMGIRLDGAALEHKTAADIISDGTVMGAVQVPSDGHPIILMADRQTTGGYTKIGTVIKEDIAKIAQMGAMNKLCFTEISLSDAQKEYEKFEQKILDARESVK